MPVDQLLLAQSYLVDHRALPTLSVLCERMVLLTLSECRDTFSNLPFHGQAIANDTSDTFSYVIVSWNTTLVWAQSLSKSDSDKSPLTGLARVGMPLE